MFYGIFKLQEETGELNQVLGKIGQCNGIEHWQGNLAGNLNQELADTWAALRFFISRNRHLLDMDKINDEAERKYSLFCKWDAEGNMRGIG